MMLKGRVAYLSDGCPWLEPSYLVPQPLALVARAEEGHFVPMYLFHQSAWILPAIREPYWACLQQADRYSRSWFAPVGSYCSRQEVIVAMDL